MTVRVLVVDDSPTMRAILMSRLSNEPDISVIGTAANAAEARELIKQLDPDVVSRANLQFSTSWYANNLLL